MLLLGIVESVVRRYMHKSRAVLILLALSYKGSYADIYSTMPSFFQKRLDGDYGIVYRMKGDTKNYEIRRHTRDH